MLRLPEAAVLPVKKSASVRNKERYNFNSMNNNDHYRKSAAKIIVVFCNHPADSFLPVQGFFLHNDSPG
jgi:hypothetical protein